MAMALHGRALHGLVVPPSSSSMHALSSAESTSSSCSTFAASGFRKPVSCPPVFCSRRPGTVSGSQKRQLRSGSRLVCRASYGGGGALSPELKESLDSFIRSHKVVLFMKGNRNFPQCGFSNTCIQILNQFQVPYETVNILEDESLRQGVKEYSSWPTYPQLYIDGEFYGGCDITMEAYQNGELHEAIEKAMVS